MSELLPCPFCGGTDVKILKFKERPQVAVGCSTCKAIGPFVDEAGPTVDDDKVTKRNVTEAWNQRKKQVCQRCLDRNIDSLTGADFGRIT